MLRNRTTSAARNLRFPKTERGFTLIIGLVFLLLLALLGLGAMQSSILDEKMSGNDRDRNLAFQAAEAALRDAERDIKGLDYTGAVCTNLTPCRPFSKGLPSFSNGYGTRLADFLSPAPNCADGICYFPVDDANREKWAASSATTENKRPYTFWSEVAMQDLSTDKKSYKAATRYGTYTGAPALANLASTPNDLTTDQQPIYWIEVIDKNAGQVRTPYYYRITALAVGARSSKGTDKRFTGTIVVLQAIIDPDPNTN